MTITYIKVTWFCIDGYLRESKTKQNAYAMWHAYIIEEVQICKYNKEKARREHPHICKILIGDAHYFKQSFILFS